MSGFFSKSREIDMCTEPLLKKLLIFVLPIMISNLLQRVFNLADTVVVGRFAAEGNDALAAVGTTGAVTVILLNFAIGLSVGVNVLVARYYGAKDFKKVSDAVHTSILLSIIVGVLISVAGVFLTPMLLDFVAVPEDIRPMSQTYMVIYFCGFIFTSVYNFGSAILRAVGDTQRPLVYMFIAGLLNVILNLIFVIFLHMSVAGVALATVISQGVSAVLVVLTLTRTDACYQVRPGQLRLNGAAAKQILLVGLPASVQSMLFDVPNAVVQSAVNSFGKVVMAAHTASGNVGGLLYMPLGSIEHGTLAFVSQNYGARNMDNIRKIERKSVLINTIAGLTITTLVFTVGRFLLKIYDVDSEEMMRAGMLHLWIGTGTAFTCSMMTIYAALMRGIGYSIKPTIVSLVGSCAVRILWVIFILPLHYTLGFLYVVYPISWVLTTGVHFICFRRALRKKERELAAAGC